MYFRHRRLCIFIYANHNREEKVKQNPLFPYIVSKEISWDLEIFNQVLLRKKKRKL